MNENILNSQDVFKKVFDFSPEAIIILDNKGTIVEGNNRLYDWLGYKNNEIIGKNILALPFITKKSKAIAMKNLAQRFLGLKIMPYNLVFISKNGDEVIGKINASIMKNDDGKSIGDLVMVSNITKQVAVENEILKTRQALDKNAKAQQEILDSIPAMVFYKDVNNNILKVNKNFADSMNMKKEEMEGKNCQAIWPNQATEYYKDDKEVIKAGVSKRNIIEKLETPNGIKWVKTDKILHKNLNNEIIGIIGFSLDISQQMKAEEKYKILYYTSYDAIMTLTMEEGFLSGNPATIKMFGCKDEAEFITLTPAQVSPLRQPDGALSGEKAKKMMEIAMQKGSNLFEWEHCKLNGENFSATVLLTRMEYYKKNMLQATVRDITQQKKAEKELFRHTKELEKINELMIGREIKMVELKKKIHELESNLKKNN